MASPRTSLTASPSDRTTVSLSDKKILRGTTPLVLFEWGGYYLSSSFGDEATYMKSAVVTKLDYFLSHSWHAPWRQKFMTVFIFFNGIAISVISWVTAFALAEIRHQFTKPGDVFIMKVHQLEKSLWVAISDELSDNMKILCATLIFTAFWGRLRELPCWKESVFLDKVCIHQTNTELKIAGIKSIGAFLASSNCLLIVWDKTYFSRLWCVYEIAAFMFARPGGCITLLPVTLGFFIVALLVVCDCAVVCQTLTIDLMFAKGHDPFFFGLCCSLWFVFSLLLSWMSWSYDEELIELKRQITTFSVSSANCFCCNCQHVHPETGDVLPCDREVVYASIRYWYDDVDHTHGLAKFDNQVRGWGDQGGILQKITSTIIPYSSACAICCPWCLGTLKVVSWMKYSTFLIRCFMLLSALEVAFLRGPLLIAGVLRINRVLHVTSIRAGKLIAFSGVIVLGCSVAATIIGHLTYGFTLGELLCDWAMGTKPVFPEVPLLTLQILILVIEVLAVWFVFGKTHVHHDWQTVDEVEMVDVDGPPSFSM